MAPIVDHHAAMAEALSFDHSVASGSGSVAAHLAVKKYEDHRAEEGRFGSPKIVVSDDEFDLPRIGDMIAHANNSSSLFMDECQNDSVSGIFPEEFITTADMKTSALMSSFDALDGTLDDIDLLSSPRSTPCKEQLLYETDSSAAAAIMFSTDEELARQLQAEEDEYARKQRDIIFRKGQSTAATAAATSSPPRKLKRSWLDDLIGEPFPSEMRRNYARSDSRQSTTSSGLMAAIAAAEARVTSAAIDSSILVDRTNTDSISSFNVDEGINKLSSTLSNWWSSNVVISPQNNHQDDPTTMSSEDPPRFTDNGIEGYYLGDFRTDTNNNLPIQPLQRHGQGIMTYNSGDTFTGNFQNNVFHGWGIYLWNDGDKQRGTWYNGLRHGPCIFHHSASDIVEYGYYNEGKVVGEGVRLNAERNKAWKLVDGVRLEGTIEMEEAERIVSERFECFPIPVPAKKRFVVFDDKEGEEDFI